MHGWVRDLLCKPNIYVSWSTSELREWLVPWNMFNPSSKILFTDRSKAVLLLWNIFVIYVLFVMPSCLFITALWSPAGKGLASWLTCIWSSLVVLSLTHVMSWLRCGSWLHRFLIFAFLLTCCLLTESTEAIWKLSESKGINLSNDTPISSPSSFYCYRTCIDNNTQYMIAQYFLEGLNERGI